MGFVLAAVKGDFYTGAVLTFAIPIGLLVVAIALGFYFRKPQPHGSGRPPLFPSVGIPQSSYELALVAARRQQKKAGEDGDGSPDGGAEGETGEAEAHAEAQPDAPAGSEAPAQSAGSQAPAQSQAPGEPAQSQAPADPAQSQAPAEPVDPA